MMQHNRRDFMKGWAGMGALGAMTMAMGSFPGSAQAKTATAAKNGYGPAIEGPYLDLRTGRGNQLAYARIQSDIDFGQHDLPAIA